MDIKMAKKLSWLMRPSMSSTPFFKSTSTSEISKAAAYTTPGDMAWREAVERAKKSVADCYGTDSKGRG